jgi:hypothetical protein
MDHAKIIFKKPVTKKLSIKRKIGYDMEDNEISDLCKSIVQMEMNNRGKD